MGPLSMRIPPVSPMNATPASVVEVADVVRRVAGRVRDVEFARAERKRFAAFQDAQIFLRHRQRFAEQDCEFVAPEACPRWREVSTDRPCDARRWCGRRPVSLRIFAHERSGGAGVVEMNVREQDGVEIGDRDTPRAELFAKRRKRRFGPGIDDRAMIFGFEQRGCDGFRAADPIHVEYGDFVHGVRL